MSKIKLCEIRDGEVVNIANADDQDIPPHMASWVVGDGNAVIGGTWDGSSFGPVPQSTIDERQDKLLEELVDGVMETQSGIKALALTVFDIYDRLSDAGIPGFPNLTDAQKRAFIKSKL